MTDASEGVVGGRTGKAGPGKRLTETEPVFSTRHSWGLRPETPSPRCARRDCARQNEILRSSDERSEARGFGGVALMKRGLTRV